LWSVSSKPFPNTFNGGPVLTPGRGRKALWPAVQPLSSSVLLRSLRFSRSRRDYRRLFSALSE
jgi:hypothetical protein